MLRDFMIARHVTPCKWACNLCRNKIAKQVATQVATQVAWCNSALEQIAVNFRDCIAIDKRTRYPEVKIAYTTSFKPTQAKPILMFAHHGEKQLTIND